MSKMITVFPIGRQNKEAVEVMLDTDTSLQQLKDRIRAAIGAASDTQVMVHPLRCRCSRFPTVRASLLVALVDLI